MKVDINPLNHFLNEEHMFLGLWLSNLGLRLESDQVDTILFYEVMGIMKKGHFSL